MKRPSWPIALTIAGSDSGGGAGIQADLKTFAAMAVHGTSAITCLTAQSPTGVTGVQPAEPRMVRLQLDAVFAELRPAAAKTGMLFNAAIIAEVVAFWKHGPCPPLVVDPVMVATSGASLLQPDAVELIKKRLLPLATLITPNLDEAVALTGFELCEPEDLRRAACELARRYRTSVLVKGGHLRGLNQAVDVFYEHPSGTEQLLTAPYLRGVSTHGTGCTYSAAITAGLAQGWDLATAVGRAKRFITRAIAGSVRVGRHDVLNSFWKQHKGATSGADRG
jgi:hydroxymethylpyrimidine/phosphomethylpyrimidine kinase